MFGIRWGMIYLLANTLRIYYLDIRYSLLPIVPLPDGMFVILDVWVYVFFYIFLIAHVFNHLGDLNIDFLCCVTTNQL